MGSEGPKYLKFSRLVIGKDQYKTKDKSGLRHQPVLHFGSNYWIQERGNERCAITVRDWGLDNDGPEVLIRSYKPRTSVTAYKYDGKRL